MKRFVEGQDRSQLILLPDCGRIEQVDASIARYLRALDQADREESDIAEAKSNPAS